MAETKIVEKRRLISPAITPQALAWDPRDKTLWMGSRDLRRIYVIDPENGTVLKQQEAPGIPWAAVTLNGELRFTIGEGAEDDRYIYRYTPKAGFSKMFACPEFTGSYLSFDGKNLYMSQWYKKRVLMFDDQGNVIREINVGAEISGHTFANGSLYVLRGQEQPNEDWRIARLNPQEETPAVEDIAVVPFASRSLTFDGESLVQLSRERHDHFVHPAELEGFLTDRSTGYCTDCFVVGQAEPPSNRIFHEPSGCLTHVEVKVPICAPASSKTGPLENPRSPAAFVTTRSGCQRKGATDGLKNSDQPAITSCFPCTVLRRPRNWASSARYKKNCFASRSANALANAISVARTSSARSAAEAGKAKTRRSRPRWRLILLEPFNIAGGTGEPTAGVGSPNMDTKRRRFMRKW